jgi:hypothetical protein
LIPGQDQIQDKRTHDFADVAHVVFQKIMEVYSASFSHHIIAHIVAVENQKDRSDVMEALNIFQIFVFGKKIIQDAQYCLLFLASELILGYRWNLVMVSKVFIDDNDR